jgi:hypothetical protein
MRGKNEVVLNSRTLVWLLGLAGLISAADNFKRLFKTNPGLGILYTLTIK